MVNKIIFYTLYVYFMLLFDHHHHKLFVYNNKALWNYQKITFSHHKSRKKHFIGLYYCKQKVLEVLEIQLIRQSILIIQI